MEITVYLPRVKFKIETFATYLPMFSQDFGDLREYLTVGQFSLEGSHRPINTTVCDHLNAHMNCAKTTESLYFSICMLHKSW